MTSVSAASPFMMSLPYPPSDGGSSPKKEYCICLLPKGSTVSKAREGVLVCAVHRAEVLVGFRNRKCPACRPLDQSDQCHHRQPPPACLFARHGGRIFPLVVEQRGQPHEERYPFAGCGSSPFHSGLLHRPQETIGVARPRNRKGIALRMMRGVQQSAQVPKH